MVTRARELLLYTDSSDIEVRNGRKWKTQEMVDQALSQWIKFLAVGAEGQTAATSEAVHHFIKAAGEAKS